MKNILLLGCSTVSFHTHHKGIDSFTQTEYSLGGARLRAALETSGATVTHIASPDIARDMPCTVEGLQVYDAVIVSDVGSNTFLLSPATTSAQFDVDRLKALADYVRSGGGLVLIGGYFAFTGVNATARYGATALAPILPVELQPTDDRVEVPDGAAAEIIDPSHPILYGVPSEWPALLGYNRTVLRPSGRGIANIEGAPLLAVAHEGDGRVVTFLSDAAPHWAPQSFLDWPGYDTLWSNIIGWAGAWSEEPHRGNSDTEFDGARREGDLPASVTNHRHATAPAKL